jgi:L-lactate dehydrogenase
MRFSRFVMDWAAAHPVLAGFGLAVGLLIVFALLPLVVSLLPVRKVPLRYNLRNLQARWKTTLVTGIAFTLVTAGAKQKPGQSRMDLATANVAICRKMLPELTRLSPGAVLLMVTNPVDVMTYVALKLTGWPRQRVLGSGTVLDSSRFRFLIARRCNVAVQNVHAYVAGEHGESEIPLWSSARIANVALHEWAVPAHGKLTVRDRTDIFVNVRDAAQQIIAGKGATNYAIGLATAKILEAILKDENRILPVSSLLTNYHGIDDVCLSVPCIVNRMGVEVALDFAMNDAESAGLRNSADRIKEAIRSLGF